MSKVIENTTFYTIKEVAEKLQVNPETVRNYIRRGQLVGKQIGRPIYISETSLRVSRGRLKVDRN
jgi:excisionase family DNA binding protein